MHIKKCGLRALIAGVATMLACSMAHAVTADDVLRAMTAGGVAYTDVTHPARDPESPLPGSYDERVAFVLESVAPNGGQVFVCTRRTYCDAIYDYFEMLRALAGPYLYRSADGLVVAQINSGLSPSEAERIESVIDGLP